MMGTEGGVRVAAGAGRPAPGTMLPLGERGTTPLAPREPQVLMPLHVQPAGMGSAEALVASPRTRTARHAKEMAQYFEGKMNFIWRFLPFVERLKRFGDDERSLKSITVEPRPNGRRS